MAETNCEGLTFSAWMAAVDKAVGAATGGMSHDDFADAPYWDNWESGTPPEDMLAEMAEYDEILSAILSEGGE